MRHEAQLSAEKVRIYNVTNVAILYGADGISIGNRIGMDHNRQTSYVGLVAPSVESIYKTPSSTRSKGIAYVDSFPPVFNTLVWINP